MRIFQVINRLQRFIHELYPKVENSIKKREADEYRLVMKQQFERLRERNLPIRIISV